MARSGAKWRHGIKHEMAAYQRHNGVMASINGEIS